MIVLPRDMPCRFCPFNYDLSTCKAVLAEKEVWSDADNAFVPARFGVDSEAGRYTEENSDGSDCDVLKTRPDWCPLSSGAVLVEIEK